MTERKRTDDDGSIPNISLVINGANYGRVASLNIIPGIQSPLDGPFPPQYQRFPPKSRVEITALDFPDQMTEARARELLEQTKENWLGGYYDFQGDTVQLDGHFTADQLEAIAWVMRNGVEPKED